MKIVRFSLVAAVLVAACGPYSWESTKPNPGYHADGGAGGGGGSGGNMSSTDMSMPPDMAVQCTSSSKCAASAPVCASGTCSACGSGTNSECATYHPQTPLCGPAGGCVQCLSKDDCDALHQACDTTSNACVACTANEQCTSGLCNTNGTCADKSTLLYVAGASAACSDSGVGAFAQPFCTLQKGLNASAASSPTKPVIVFAGKAYAESLQAAPSLNGGGNYVAQAIGVNTPMIQPSTGALATVTGLSGKQVAVSFDGFFFDGTSATDGIKCAGDNVVADYATTSLTITRSTVTHSPTKGVAASANSTLTLDADFISNNVAGGIEVNTSNFTLTNLLISGNGKADSSAGAGDGSAFGGINLSAGGQDRAHMLMFNDTVVANLASATIASASGISCSAVPTLANTVIFGNQGPSAQTTAGCQPSYSAYPGAGTNANNNQDLSSCQASDLFIQKSADPYQPIKGGSAPCTLVDDGTSSFMSVNAPAHDIVGATRPQPAGGKFDIGCYEAQ